ncbi:hypothetical protein PoB_007474100 [Plakobranchus ocellatus]|uniref:Uncharacterized protein n=1 Tax=Plakobranchus ocellatus TaxID=259542 RepID=A0AAV4DWF5_9GAST|nr:hypothetical protein PoB_007474100 [Plakobranchus ocellatus]
MNTRPSKSPMSTSRSRQFPDPRLRSPLGGRTQTAPVMRCDTARNMTISEISASDWLTFLLYSLYTPSIFSRSVALIISFANLLIHTSVLAFLVIDF